MSTSTEKQTTDVLIVGAGPAGTMLALELAAQGMAAFRILDKAPRRSDTSRAVLVQPRSFEVMNRHGDARELYKKGSMTGGPMVWVNGAPVVDVDFREVANYRDSAFALPCLLSQVDTEAYLDQCLKERYGVEIERGFYITKVVQDADDVSTTIRNDITGTEETIRSKYVVGADGVHSVVRQSSLQWTFAGDTYPGEFIMCDANLKDFWLPKDRYHLILGIGLFIVFPMTGGWFRIMASRGSSPTAGAPITVDEMNILVREALPLSGWISDATWLSNFKLHHRIANSYRDGRMFLVGDAAHIHSSVCGQGLDTALQDSVNLGWKLARVLCGERPDSLLDTYDAERRRIGLELIAKTDRIFNIVSMRNRVGVSLRNLAIPWLGRFITSPSSLRHVYGFMSQFTVNYRQSPLTLSHQRKPFIMFSGAVKAGDRAPDGDIEIKGVPSRLHDLLTPASHHLLLFSDSTSRSPGGCQDSHLQYVGECIMKFNPVSARVHTIVRERRNAEFVGGSGRKCSGSYVYSHSLHGVYGFSGLGFAYIRPDGYVAAIDVVDRYDEFLKWLMVQGGGFRP